MSIQETLPAEPSMLPTPQRAVRAAGASVEYRPQIDTLRALAVFGVLITHFVPAKYAINQILPWGTLGVRLFFVISGFLITAILLRGKTLMEREHGTLGQIARRFYARRFLRILPIFFATLFLITFFDFPHVRESLWWHAAFLSNFWVAQHGWIGPYHFWSLAVEEQFYLLWPCIVLITPFKRLRGIAIAMVVFALLYRGAVTKMGGWLWSDIMMPGCLDTLMLGSLLAILRDPRSRFDSARVSRLAGISLFIGLALMSFHLIMPRLGYALKGLHDFAGDFSLGLIFVWMVDRCSQGVPGVVGRLLMLRPILYVGRISYGIYLLHVFVPELMEKLSLAFGFSVPEAVPVRFVLFSAIAIGLAAISWHVFERPINDLKRYFPYGAKPTGANRDSNQ